MYAGEKAAIEGGITIQGTPDNTPELTIINNGEFTSKIMLSLTQVVVVLVVVVVFCMKKKNNQP